MLNGAAFAAASAACTQRDTTTFRRPGRHDMHHRQSFPRSASRHTLTHVCTMQEPAQASPARQTAALALATSMRRTTYKHHTREERVQVAAGATTVGRTIAIIFLLSQQSNCESRTHVAARHLGEPRRFRRGLPSVPAL